MRRSHLKHPGQRHFRSGAEIILASPSMGEYLAASVVNPMPISLDPEAV
jgi:hypothetical protein